MKLIVKNKFMSLKGSSVVKDENENPLYEVKGKLFSPTKKKQVYDMAGNKLYTIRNKLFNFFLHSAYIYDANGNKIAKLKNRISRNAQYLSKGYENTYRVGKNPDGKGRLICKNDQVIGIWRFSGLHLTDTFEIEYNSYEDAAIIVAIIVAIDNINDNSQDDFD